MTPHELARYAYPLDPTSFDDGFEAAIDYLTTQRGKVQTTNGIGWIPANTIDGAIALLTRATDRTS